MARNNGVSSTSSGQQGLAVRTRAAKGPACESSRALFQLGGISFGLDLKKFLGGPILKIEIFNAFLFIFYW